MTIALRVLFACGMVAVDLILFLVRINAQMHLNFWMNWFCTKVRAVFDFKPLMFMQYILIGIAAPLYSDT